MSAATAPPRTSRGADLCQHPNPDLFDLARFVEAQTEIYDRSLAELRAGRKRSHWMWFVLPQIADLGRSETARRYSIGSAAEARAYLDHPLLGARLRECVNVLLALQGPTASEIFGYPDDLKLRSCLTLFAAVSEDEAIFENALDRYFAGERDLATLARLDR
jgi:uncharacterized protein (DUF1810 family)